LLELRHAAVVQKFPPRMVSEIGTPVVSLIHVGHRRGNPLRPHRMRFAEQRLAINANTPHPSQVIDRGAKARSTRAMMSTSCSWTSYLS